MNLEKLALTLFVKYVSHLQQIGGHVQGSLRELALACSSVIKLTSQITVHTPFLKRLSPLQSTFRSLTQTLESAALLLDQKHPTHMPSQNQTRREIIESIIMTLDDEIDVLAESSQDNVRLKIEALMTVKNVLTTHIQLDNLESTSTDRMPIQTNAQV